MKIIRLLFIIISLGTTLADFADSRALFDIETSQTSVAKAAADEPYVMIASHKIGKIGLTVSNQGHFGVGFAGEAVDPFSGGDAPSCTFPYPGQCSYLFAGSFWVGAVVGRDTLVSVGADGWHGTLELWPDREPRGEIIHRTLLNPADTDAISEQDFIAIYSDTLADPQRVTIDPFDGRPHKPLGIEVSQRSYAWSYSYAEDFVLFDYSIKNIGRRELNNVYMGFYVDGDVQISQGGQGYADDICGFKRDIPSVQGCGFKDTINIAYIADNDGRESNAFPCPFTSTSLTSVTGMRVVRTPSDSLKLSFNWWISNGAASRDFGPRRMGTPDDPFRNFGGFLGTPEGDKNKYYVMRHGEFDYDQLFSAVNQTSEGWLPPGDQAADFADGFDTRYLLSFGPFDISPGEVLPVSFAYVAGEDFHTQCYAFRDLFDPYSPWTFYNQLNFEDLGKNAIWASWIYDNPGVDTDGDKRKGKYRICAFDSLEVIDTIQIDSLITETTYVYTKADTMYYEGDGVPDFRGAAPPPAPSLWIMNEYDDTVRSRIYPVVTESNMGELKIQWNGLHSETEKDMFSNQVDFEGYRLWLSLSPSRSDYVLLSSYDIEDYNKWIWNDGRLLWELKDPPFYLDSLQKLYGEDGQFNPLDHGRDYPFEWKDSVFYFAKQDWNQSNYRDTSEIHKIYPDQPYPSTLNPDTARVHFPEELTPDGAFKYFEYEYILRNLLPSKLYYVAVTAFDYGSPASGLSSLETSPTRNFVAEYAQISNSVVEDSGLNVTVYPNPYRADANYVGLGFEGRNYVDSIFGGKIIQQEGMLDDRIRSIHFINLPHKCTIRIYSIDGDLIRQIEHDYPKDSPRSMHERWDMISRNTQAVVSGIYYYSIESEFGSQIGKIVIIL